MEEIHVLTGGSGEGEPLALDDPNIVSPEPQTHQMANEFSIDDLNIVPEDDPQTTDAYSPHGIGDAGMLGLDVSPVRETPEPTPYRTYSRQADDPTQPNAGDPPEVKEYPVHNFEEDDEKLNVIRRILARLVCGKCKKKLLETSEAQSIHVRTTLNQAFELQKTKDGRYYNTNFSPVASNRVTCGHVSTCVECPHCSTKTCGGCGEVVTGNTYRRAKKYTSGGISVAACCREGWLFLLWTVLCIDKQVKDWKPKEKGLSRWMHRKIGKSTVAGPSTTKNSAATTPTTTQGGSSGIISTFMSGAMPKGIGYGGPGGLYGPSYYEATSSSDFKSLNPLNPLLGLNSHVPKRWKAGSKQDMEMGMDFALGAACLAAYFAEADGTTSCNVEVVAAILRRSPILDCVALVLQRDYVHDICCGVDTDVQLYISLIAFLTVMSNHHALTLTLCERRYDYIADHRPVNLMTSALVVTSGRQTRSSSARNQTYQDALHATSSKETLEPIMKHLGAWRRQATLLSAKASLDVPTYCNPASNDMIYICKRVIQLYDILASSVFQNYKPSHTNNVTTSQTTEEELERKIQAHDRALQTWHRNNAVDQVPDESLCSYSEHNQSIAREATARSQDARLRMKRLVFEIASMHSSLPTGIYVRHAESRVGLMRVLVTGPRGTPYENGLYEFDVYCPLTYPFTPPKAHFVNTGSVRHNPNLYATGHVCLSLLGTWTGERWRPSESTLLQLFVSIQGMILCDEPYYNEPGHESHADPEQSKTYNTTIKKYTVAHAMLHWLRMRRRILLTANGATVSEAKLTSPETCLPVRSRVTTCPLSPGENPTGSPQQESLDTGPQVAPGDSISSNIWLNVVEHHFLHKRHAIMAQLEKWRVEFQLRVPPEFEVVERILKQDFMPGEDGAYEEG